MTPLLPARSFSDVRSENCRGSGARGSSSAAPAASPAAASGRGGPGPRQKATRNPKQNISLGSYVSDSSTRLGDESKTS